MAAEIAAFIFSNLKFNVVIQKFTNITLQNILETGFTERVEQVMNRCPLHVVVQIPFNFGYKWRTLIERY